MADTLQINPVYHAEGTGLICCEEERRELIETTAKELLENHKKCFCRLKRKEQDNSTTDEAKENFRRKPYMGMYRKQDQCGNDLGGR